MCRSWETRLGLAWPTKHRWLENCHSNWPSLIKRLHKENWGRLTPASWRKAPGLYLSTDSCSVLSLQTTSSKQEMKSVRLDSELNVLAEWCFLPSPERLGCSASSPPLSVIWPQKLTGRRCFGELRFWGCQPSLEMCFSSLNKAFDNLVSKVRVCVASCFLL